MWGQSECWHVFHYIRHKVVAHPTPKEDVQPCGRKNQI